MARYRDIAPFFGPLVANGKSGEIYLIKDIVTLSKRLPYLVKVLLCVESDSRETLTSHRNNWMLSLLTDIYFNDFESSALNEDCFWLINEYERLAMDLENKSFGGEMYRLSGYYSVSPVHYAKGWEDMSNALFHKMLISISRDNWEGARRYWKNHCRNLAEPMPHPGRKRKGGSFFRSIGTKQEKTWNIAHSMEHGEVMVRGRRRNLPDAWWDFVRHVEEGWKNNSKDKRQWMKHVNR